LSASHARHAAAAALQLSSFRVGKIGECPADWGVTIRTRGAPVVRFGLESEEDQRAWEALLERVAGAAPAPAAAAPAGAGDGGALYETGRGAAPRGCCVVQ
jgi:hypothetical protein